MNKLEAGYEAVSGLCRILVAPLTESAQERDSGTRNGMDSDADLACCCAYPIIVVFTLVGTGFGFVAERFGGLPNGTLIGAGLGALAIPAIIVGSEVYKA
ncbi:MAG: hypothetical protein M1484_03155 [Patescibacteria group bacterium]|nr:hypothetical protein [Patescibacteria group bacterium]MCL5432061.1 hypothetical protein [Patescibacteria group bacterium]